MIRPATVQWPTKRLPDRVDGPVSCPNAYSATNNNNTVTTAAAVPAVPTPHNPPTKPIYNINSKARHDWREAAMSSPSSTVLPNPGLLVPSASPTACYTLRTEAGAHHVTSSRQGATHALESTHPHLAKIIHRTTSLQARVLAADLAREAALLAREAAVATCSPDLSLAQARLDVAELNVRALEVETARASRDKKLLAPPELAHCSRSFTCLKISPTIPNRNLHHQRAICDALSALDADVAFALSAHERARKRLMQAVTALSEIVGSLANTESACVQAELKSKTGLLSQVGSPVARKEDDKSSGHLQSWYDQRSSSSSVFLRQRSAECTKSCDNNAAKSTSSSNHQEPDQKSCRLSASTCGRPQSEISSITWSSAESAGFEACSVVRSDQPSFRPKCESDNLQNQGCQSIRSALSKQTDKPDECDEILSCATDSSVASPSSPFDEAPLFGDVMVSIRRADSPPTSPFSDDSHSFVFSSASPYDPTVDCNGLQSSPSLSLSSGRSSSPVRRNRSDIPAMWDLVGISDSDRGPSDTHRPTASILDSPWCMDGFDDSAIFTLPSTPPTFRAKVLSSVFAPRRTLARFQLARIRIPTVVKELWGEANYHMVAAAAHAPCILTEKTYVLHFKLYVSSGDSASAGILGAFPNRKSCESMSMYARRLRNSIRSAIPVLTELISCEDKRVNSFRKDRRMVQDELRRAEQDCLDSCGHHALRIAFAEGKKSTTSLAGDLTSLSRTGRVYKKGSGGRVRSEIPYFHQQ